MSGRNTYEFEFLANEPMIDGIRPTGSCTVKAPITFQEPLTVYTLVDGGWIPPPFAMPPNLLVDRNVVSALKQIRGRTQRADLHATDWWLRFFHKGHALFNPLLYALEGHSRKAPTFEEFVVAFEDASYEITSAFPGSKVLSFSQAQYQILHAVENRSAQETAFLLETVPLVIDRIPNERLEAVEAAILESASKHHVGPRSLVVMAVLSCLYEDLQGAKYSVGRHVLKPRQRYGQDDAYNALADLRNLELFIVSRGLPELGSFSLCTCDRALALLWCGLSARNVQASNSVMGCVIDFSVSLDHHLFPHLTEVNRQRLKVLLSQ
jgi:hypothetical protein